MNDESPEFVMPAGQSAEDGVSLALGAYQKLKELIINGAMFPGTPLKEAELSERFGMSRTPVREALRMLRSEGLVQTVPNRGAHVAHISRQEVLDAYEVREWLEPALAGRAAQHVDMRQLDRLSSLLGEMPVPPLTHRESIEADKIDSEFHEVILRAGQNKVAFDLVMRARSITHTAAFFVAAVRYQRSREEHLEILDALRKHDAKRAETAMRRHIAVAKRRFVQAN